MGSPALRISNIVMGRQNEGQRVSYLVAPDGNGQARATPETVVLKRWRQRRMEGYTFSGSRLSPTVWRAIAFAFPEFLLDAAFPLLDGIGLRIQATDVALKRRHLSLPSEEVLRALLLDLGPDRLRRLIDRHTSEAHKGKSGVPDLYLFAHSGHSSEEPSFSRFVEVKEPKEPVSTSQHAEIAFMQELGLQVRVLKLIERQ